MVVEGHVELVLAGHGAGVEAAGGGGHPLLQRGQHAGHAPRHLGRGLDIRNNNIIE